MIEGTKFIPAIEIEEEKLTAKELTTEQELTDFWIAYRRAYNLSVENPSKEQKLATLQAKKSIAEMAGDKTLRFFGAKDGDRMVGTGAIEVWIDENNTKWGYLSLLTVDAGYRGKNVAKHITDRRIASAIELDCDWVYAHIYISNPTALVTKFNDGYVLKETAADAFVLYKKIGKVGGESEYDPKKNQLKDLQELQLTDLATIKKLLKKGWVGIDIKNSGDEKDNDPKLWTLIMEKQ